MTNHYHQRFYKQLRYIFVQNCTVDTNVFSFYLSPDSLEGEFLVRVGQETKFGVGFSSTWICLLPLISEVKKSEIYYSEPRSTTSNCCIKPYPYYSLEHSQMPILSHLGASLLEKTICDERWNTFDAEEKIHAGTHENQKINCHRPNLNNLI